MSGRLDFFPEARLLLDSTLSVERSSLHKSLIVIIGWEGLGQFRKMMGA